MEGSTSKQRVNKKKAKRPTEIDKDQFDKDESSQGELLWVRAAPYGTGVSRLEIDAGKAAASNQNQSLERLRVKVVTMRKQLCTDQASLAPGDSAHRRYTACRRAL